MNKKNPMTPIFYPKSVAVIGASSNKKKIGYEVLSNLRRFSGKIFPINPSKEKIFDKITYASVLDIPQDIDLAIITVPAHIVGNVVEQCGEKGVKGIIILSAGFKEIGNNKMETKLKTISESYDMRMIGPNSVGLINNANDLNATFVMPSKKGKIAFLSQSGALSSAIIYKTVYEDIGFSKFVSLGNMADVGFSELITYLSDDDDTASIAMYIEQVDNGKKFVRAAKECSLKKPIIALKSGRSNAGSRATKSHTGSLAGSDRIYDAVFSQTGILRADTIDEMIDYAKAFSLPLPKGNRVAILTNAGGPGILATDVCEENGLIVPPLQDSTKKALKKILPTYASVSNPIDTIAQAGYTEFYESMKIIDNDEGIDCILAVIVVPTFSSIGLSTHAKAIIDAWNREKPLITCFMSGEISLSSRRLMLSNEVPSYPTPERAAKSLGALWKYTRWYNEHKNLDKNISFRG